jgi:hypothetical protein
LIATRRIAITTHSWSLPTFLELGRFAGMDPVELVYASLCARASDINEHLPTLSNYAAKCESVFETGVRGVVSSWAFAHGLCRNGQSVKRLFLNDICPCDIKELTTANIAMGAPIELSNSWVNNLELQLPSEFDLTFIDTWHVYGQLKRELIKFAPLTRKYIIMHDTTVDEWLGETLRMGWDAQSQSATTGIPVAEITRGIWPAVEEFLGGSDEWELCERFTNNNGLTVLARRPH